MLGVLFGFDIFLDLPSSLHMGPPFEFLPFLVPFRFFANRVYLCDAPSFFVIGLYNQTT